MILLIKDVLCWIVIDLDFDVIKVLFKIKIVSVVRERVEEIEIVSEIFILIDEEVEDCKVMVIDFVSKIEIWIS